MGYNGHIAYLGDIIHNSVHSFFPMQFTPRLEANKFVLYSKIIQTICMPNKKAAPHIQLGTARCLLVEAGGIESLYPKISKTLANTKFYLGHNLRFVPIICTKLQSSLLFPNKTFYLFLLNHL